MGPAVEDDVSPAMREKVGSLLKLVSPDWRERAATLIVEIIKLDREDNS